MSRTLAELLDGGVEVQAPHAPSLSVTAIVEDSRRASPGCLFIARPGSKDDGRRYIADAVQRGAAAILSDGSAPVPKDIAHLTADDIPLAAAILAERFYDCPSRHLKLIGITGTNGKTTTAHLIHQLLSLPHQCGLIGTVAINDGRTSRPADLTTPAAIDISRLLRSMVDAGCSACVMEVSSHALHQKRVAALDFDIAIFTNLSGDHLDYHGTMEEYAAAKAMLFARGPRIAIVNADDPRWSTMTERLPKSSQLIRCSLDDPGADCFADVQEEDLRGVAAIFRGPWGMFESHLSLIGAHNAMNALQAIAAGHALGMTEAQIMAALGSCAAPPGRLEPVTSSSDPFAVFVDYAHTDDALDNVLSAIKPLVPVGGALRVVFGCGGDRDRTKRPRMAQAAWRWADEVIITSDNPRAEPPEAIIREIMTGVPCERAAHTTCITDRRDAIHEAIDRARPNDIILIAGKGHETYQIIGTERRPFDDRIIASEALEERAARMRPSRRATGT